MLAVKVIQIAAIFCSTVCCCLGDIGACSEQQTKVTDECLRNLKNNLVKMDFNKLCIFDYFHECRQEIVEELRSCIPEQRVQFVMDNIKAKVDGGVRYLCFHKDRIREAWNKCGPNCSYALIESYHLCGFMDIGYYPTTTSLSESDCRKADNIAICMANKFKSSFPKSDVHEIILEYHKFVTKLSPCRQISVFTGNGAGTVSKISKILVTLAVILTMIHHGFQ